MKRNRTVLVTGASRGIGLAVAKRLLSEGYRVIGARNRPEAEGENSPGFPLHPLELSDPGSIDRLVEIAGPLHALINNAGISMIGPAGELPCLELEKIIRVNFLGPARLAKKALPPMMKAGHGTVVQIGSMAATFPVPFQSAYVASKSALAGFTRSLRTEVAPFGVRVCLLEPMDVRTGITPGIFVEKESPYEENVSRMMANRLAAMVAAPPPDLVARQVSRILRARRVKPVYHAGATAPVLCFLKRLLPESVVEKFVKRRYGLN